MALAWKAGWVNALRGSNPLSSALEGPVTSQSAVTGPSACLARPGLRTCARALERAGTPVTDHDRGPGRARRELALPGGARRKTRQKSLPEPRNRLPREFGRGPASARAGLPHRI